MAGTQGVQAELTEPRVGAGLRDDRSDTRSHVDAARAHCHLAGRDRDAEHARALAAADEREGHASRLRRKSAISSVAAMPCGMAFVSDTNAWICPGYSRSTTSTPASCSRRPYA